jgi:glycerol-3-phosphate O-acyltransferase
LQQLIRSMGAYFVRRNSNNPIYRRVLERYVHMATEAGVAQAMYPEGGLSRDGRLREPKLGLFDYMLKSFDPKGTHDIVFVPVALNYDRVLEDRSLIRELVDERDRPGRFTQLVSVAAYVITNVGRLITGRLRRYGRAAVNFGTPVSLKAWLATAPAGVLTWPRERRLPELDRLAREMMERIGAIIPVTPVPLAAAALLSFERSVIPYDALLERMDELRDRLHGVNAKVVRGDARISEVWDRAWRMLRLRRLVARHGASLVVLPRGRPLLEYYANSIAHLLPIRAPRLPFHKEHDRETDLPKLRPPPERA